MKHLQFNARTAKVISAIILAMTMMACAFALRNVPEVDKVQNILIVSSASLISIWSGLIKPTQSTKSVEY